MKLLHRMISLMVVILLFSGPASAAQEIGTVAEVTGGVEILRSGKLPAEPAKVGQKVAQGDVVRTKSGGKVQLQFKDDSILTIAPDSRVALNEYVYEPENNKREASIKIFQGLVHTVVNKIFKKEAPDFTVETQTAVIGVRGTDYYALAGPANSDIYNHTGKTEVRNIYAEIPGTVTLRGRQFTQVSSNRPPSLALDLTQDDIDWIESRMTPPPGKITGGSDGESQLMSLIGGNVIQTQNVKPIYTTMPGQLNVVQNLQGSVYVPPQPASITTAVSTITNLPTPFNIAISWGSGVKDLDLYLTGGPNGTVYYGNPGTSISAVSYAVDARFANGSEVITIKNWTPGQTYIAYVQDYTNRNNPSSVVLSSSSGVSMQLIKGGTVQVGTGTVPGSSIAKVIGGTPVGSTISPTSGQAGNQWQAVSINPSAGTITPINTIKPYETPSVPIKNGSVSPVTPTTNLTSTATPAATAVK